MPEIFSSAKDYLLPELTAHLGFLLALLFLANLLSQKRAPSSTMAWLLVILFLPYVGVPLYLMLGGRKMNRMARRKARVYVRDPSPPASASSSQVDRLLHTMGVPPARAGNRVQLLADGQEAYRVLERILEEARSTIHITTYILGRDGVGRELIALLARRAASGVTVRLLLDDLGSWRVGRRFLGPLLQAGGRVAFFMPVLHLPFRGRTNLRNHRKLVVADGQVGITGGMNLAFPYMGPDPGPGYWRDLSVLVEGPAAADLEELFFSDWAFATGEELGDHSPGDPLSSRADPPDPDPDRSDVIQVVASGPDVADDPLYESLLTLLFSARDRVWIVTPYFVPDETLARALTLAARRGVDLRLVLPERSNHLSADLARGSYVRELHLAGGKVLLYQPEMLHAKAVVVDETLAVIGSANMDNRSLFLNYEVALLLHGRDRVVQVADWARSLFPACQPYHPRGGWARPLAENVVRLVSPLL